MASAALQPFSAEELFIISEPRSVCGRSGVPFSQVGSWRKTASAALVSYGNIRAAENPSREKANRENPRLRSNESPSGAFKRQSGLR